jgi:hypothetical protein
LGDPYLSPLDGRFDCARVNLSAVSRSSGMCKRLPTSSFYDYDTTINFLLFVSSSPVSVSYEKALFFRNYSILLPRYEGESVMKSQHRDTRENQVFWRRSNSTAKVLLQKLTVEEMVQISYVLV